MTNEMQELQPVAEALNAASNKINATIGALNAKLAALNVGLEVWLSPDEDHVQIGYCQIGDKWQLATRRCEEIKWVPFDRFDGDTSGDFEPAPDTKYEFTALLEETRALRIRALRYIPALIRELKEEAESSLKSLERATEIAATL